MSMVTINPSGTILSHYTPIIHNTGAMFPFRLSVIQLTLTHFKVYTLFCRYFIMFILYSATSTGNKTNLEETKIPCHVLPDHVRTEYHGRPPYPHCSPGAAPEVGPLDGVSTGLQETVAVDGLNLGRRHRPVPDVDEAQLAEEGVFQVVVVVGVGGP